MDSRRSVGHNGLEGPWNAGWCRSWDRPCLHPDQPVERPPVDDFDERLKTLEDRADEINSLRQNKRQETRRLQHAERDSALGLGAGLSIAYTLIGLPMLGVGIGWILEQRGMRGAMAIGVLLGGALGLFMAFITLGRTQPKP